MTQPYKIAIIGAGMFGKVHIEHFQQEERAQVAWVCSATEATTRQAAERFKIPRWTLDYREILADPSVDAVVVATPPYLHAEQLEAALRAGKHVLMEKPLAASPREAAHMVETVNRFPDRIVIDASCRHARLQPKFAFVKAFIESGKLGRVYHIHHNHLIRTTFIEWNPQGQWAMDKNLGGGGPFVDWGVYDLSFHLGVLGDVPNLKSLRSFTINGLRDVSGLVNTSDIEQHGAAWMEFDTGLTYYYERGAGVHGETANETRIYGTKGSLRLQFSTWDANTIEYFHADPDPRKETLTVDMSAHSANDNLPLVRHFLDCLDGKTAPLMPLSLAAKHMDILFRIVSP